MGGSRRNRFGNIITQGYTYVVASLTWEPKRCRPLRFVLRRAMVGHLQLGGLHP